MEGINKDFIQTRTKSLSPWYLKKNYMKSKSFIYLFNIFNDVFGTCELRNGHTNPNVKNDHLMVFMFLHISSEIVKCQLSTPLKEKTNKRKKKE